MVKALYIVGIAALMVEFVVFGIFTFYPPPEYPDLEYSAENSERALENYQDARETYRSVFFVITTVVAVATLGTTMGVFGSTGGVIPAALTLGSVLVLLSGVITAFTTESDPLRFGAAGVGLGFLLFLAYSFTKRGQTSHS